MKLTIWGSRGSLPTPGPESVRYGGNSTCVELRTGDGRVVVLDAGSGVRRLGRALLEDPTAREIRFFFTHSHLDHLMGFPFFEPAYREGFSLSFCGGPHAQPSLRKYLARQMEPPYFPVHFSLLKANFDFRCDRREGESACSLGELECEPVPLSHPNGGYGFKFRELGKTLVFLTDNELGLRHEGGLSREEYVEVCRNADLLVHDAQYTEEEYRRTRGWGHSTYDQAVDLALEAGARRLCLFHHDPDRTDEDLDGQVERCRERIAAAGNALECFAAAEGMTVEV